MFVEFQESAKDRLIIKYEKVKLFNFVIWSKQTQKYTGNLMVAKYYLFSSKKEETLNGRRQRKSRGF